MTKNREKIFKITLGAILSALSIVLKITLDSWARSEVFGFPFYGIPLIISGLLMGPYYALLIGLVTDTVGGIIQGYKPLFLFSTLAWSVIPCLLTKETKGLKWYIVIFLTYLTASVFNSFAIYVYFTKSGFLASIYTRMGFLPAFSILIAFITGYLYERLKYTQINFERLK